ncbi:MULTISPECIES: glutathione S-transferase family protein [Sphingomonadales]|uniref:Glutathione S-transferase n=1 Tax=Sphingobium ummariense RL-3 TaxID=1346791 RepID=T0KCY1_9SPHN|nr:MULTISPECIES: glutathione binding-like protein [Sphingomonadaceae]EQB31363.1 hypothetical protein M529_15110 [Sphingobium ummariense RL-3]WOF45878.1 glutathione S-transferase N-terminal domain-containing protein [Sphingopyxis indica]
MILYYNSGSCSLASHVALEETGLKYEAVRVDLSKDQHHAPEYLLKNPWARVPALDVSGSTLTENVAILQYLADLVPERRLLPKPGTFDRALATRWLALLSSTVHVAFRPLFRPNRLATTPEGQEDVRDTGVRALNEVLGRLEAELGDRAFLLGDEYSLCDAYALVFALWTLRPNARTIVIPTPNLHRIAKTVSQRPAALAAMRQEGLAFVEPSSE